MHELDGRSRLLKPEPDERLLARLYMLGGLSIQQLDEVERRFLFDSAFEDVILEEEIDLFDALAAGTLPSDQARALRLWASAQQRTQTRLEAAFVFNRLTSDTARHPGSRVPAIRSWMGDGVVHRFSALWLIGGAGAALALVTATLWVRHTRPVIQNSTVATISQPAMIAATSAPSPIRDIAAPRLPGTPIPATPPPAASVVTIFLMADETRGSSEAAQLRLKSGTGKVVLQLASRTGLLPSQSAVQIEDANGSPVGPKDVHLRRLHGQNFLEVTLDVTGLRPGEYTVFLNQEPSPGAYPALTYHFQIVGP